jgi:hypothetical protein
VLTARHPLLHEAIVSGLATALPHAELAVLSLAPVAGAVLAGLDALGAGPAAKATLRAAL